MKRQKNLVICSHCEKEKGKKTALAEWLPIGILSIKRSYGNGQDHITLVSGDNIKVACGDCGTVAYIKKKP